MTLEDLRSATCRYIDENREAYNETGDECYRAIKEELLHILGLIDAVDNEPVAKDKLTLTELARELRKIFKFRYLTVSPYREEVLLWWDKPESDGFYWWATETCTQVAFYSDVLSVPINLSEYKDENGAIDYSKCIVEVADASE